MVSEALGLESMIGNYLWQVHDFGIINYNFSCPPRKEKKKKERKKERERKKTCSVEERCVSSIFCFTRHRTVKLFSNSPH